MSRKIDRLRIVLEGEFHAAKVGWFSRYRVCLGAGEGKPPSSSIHTFPSSNRALYSLVFVHPRSSLHIPAQVGVLLDEISQRPIGFTGLHPDAAFSSLSNSKRRRLVLVGTNFL